MEMFLMVMTLSVVGVLVSGILFAAATHQPRAATALSPFDALNEERFFMLRPPVQAAPPRGGADALVLQIERHVRLERAAAEAFLQFPTVASLHMPTLAPLAR
jgi:hypothetical protein